MLETPPKRPLTVWLTQILLLGIALFFAAYPILEAMDASRVMDSYGVSPDEASSQLLKRALESAAFISPVVIGTLAAFAGLVRRSQFARWMSVLIFSLAFLLSASLLLLKLQQIAIIPRRDSLEIIRVIVLLILPFAFILLILRLAFGEREKKFFSWTRHVLATNPPPPPSFDV